MSNSAWDEKVVIKGAGLAEGQYAVTLKDIVREDKVIQFREGLRSNSKGIVGKEYAALTAEQKAIVDAVGDEFWPSRKEGEEPRKKTATIDQYRFVFMEPSSGTELKFGATFPINMYDAAGNRMGGGKALTDFITRATGVPVTVGDEFKLSDFFKPGDEYVLSLVKKNNFTEIDPNSIMKKELAKPIVKGKEALSDRAKQLLDFLKANYQGRPKRDILDLYGSGQFGSYAETTAAWQEIMKNVKYTSDGKTLDFSEA
jgi:hypothetical protein